MQKITNTPPLLGGVLTNKKYFIEDIMEKITISTKYINIDQLLKWAGIIDTGGQILPMIQENIIKLNGKIVTERRKKVFPGDIVEIDGVGKYEVIAE